VEVDETGEQQDQILHERRTNTSKFIANPA